MLLRFIAPVAMLPRYVSTTPYGIRDNMPNQKYRHTTAEYNISIQTNSKGIRSEREIPYEKPKDCYRIVLLGDSFGMGYGVNAGDMFSERMIHYLKKKYDIAAEVVNLSTSGYGNAEELLALQHEGLKYSPDLVILAWHSSDLNDNLRSNLFELTPEGGLARKATEYLPGAREREFLQQFWLYNFLDGNSQIYNFVRDFSARTVKNWLVKSRARKIKKKQNTQEHKVTVHNRMPKINLKEKLTIGILRKIQSVCEENNIDFMILDIPNRRTRTQFISKFPSHKDIPQHFDIVSPISTFKKKHGKVLYWEKSNGHFTPLGCDLVGELLAKYIHEHFF